MKLITRQDEDDPYTHYLLNPLQHQDRRRLLAENPVVAAIVLGLNLNTKTHHQIELGCAGYLGNYFIVFEGQARCALHWHGLFWGSLTPDMLTRAAHLPYQNSFINSFF
jgi:hypothetical protein